MKRRDLIRHLESQGCELLSEGGRDSWWYNPSRNKRSAVPRHNENNEHLARKICSDPGVSKH
jgi:mRNA interferase HicA